MKEDKKSEKSSTKGDPHVKTHGGEMYDFHGGCDLILMDNPQFKDGMGMQIQIGTMINTWLSYVASSAIRIGDDTLEIAGGDNAQWLYINGVPNEPLEDLQWYTMKFVGLVLRFK